MPQVDPDDDSIGRITLRHYRYDPERRERRHVDIATFDNEREFLQEFGRAHYELEDRKRQGAADPREHFTGLTKEPGYEAQRRESQEAKWRSRAHAAHHAQDQRE